MSLTPPFIPNQGVAQHRLVVPQSMLPRRQLFLLEDSKAEMLLQRPVPRHLRERRQGYRVEPFGGRPALDLVDQCSTQTLALASRLDAHLFDVGAPVDQLHHHVAHHMVFLVGRYPRAACSRVGTNFWLLIGSSAATSAMPTSRNRAPAARSTSR